MRSLIVFLVCSTTVAKRSKVTDVELSHDVADLIDLSTAESQAQIARGFELKELLREDPKNAALLQEYSELLGEVEYSCEAERDWLTKHQGDQSGAQPQVEPSGQPQDWSAQVEPSHGQWNQSWDSWGEGKGEGAAEVFQAPRRPGRQWKGAEVDTGNDYLGAASVVGEELLVRQAKPTGGRFAARLFTKRHDYAVEEIKKGTDDKGEPGTPKYGFTGQTWSLHGRMHFVKAGEEKPAFVVRRAYNYLNPIARIFGQYMYRVLKFEDESGTGKAAIGKYAEDKVLYTITKDRIGKGLLWQREEWRIYKGNGGCEFHGVTACDPYKQIYYGITDGLQNAGKWDAKVYLGPIEEIIRGAAYLYTDGVVDQETLAHEYEVADIVHASGQNRILNWAVSTTLGLFYLSPIWSIVSAVWTDSYKIEFKHETDEILMTMLAALMDVTHDDIKERVSFGALLGKKPFPVR